MKKMTPTLALQLLWSIIPLWLNKRPCIKTWKPYQSMRADLTQVRAWYEEYHPPAWGVTTGPISNLIVVDFDGDAGQAILAEQDIQPHVRTGSGGAHLYLQYPGFPVKTQNSKTNKELGRRYPGVDVRADGGYAVFYGRSRYGPYTWLRDPEPDAITVLPPAMRQFLGLELSPVLTADAMATDILLTRALHQAKLDGRNNTGFWLACQLRDLGVPLPEAANVMMQYQRMTGSHNTKGQMEPYTLDEALASLKQAYNAPARDPWPTVEIVHRGQMLGTHTHLSEIEQEALPPVIARPRPVPLGEAAFYGLAGAIVRTLLPQTEADPAALLLSLLVAVGNVIGHTAHFIAEADQHFCNLFVILVGLSSKGRKGSSFGQIRRLLWVVDPSWADTHIQDGLVSGEGLIWAVRDAVEKQEPVQENGTVTGCRLVVVDEGVSDKRLLFVEGEFARVLRVLGRDGNTLSAILRNAWDTGDLRSQSKHSPGRATGAHISLLGHITRDELVRYLTTTEAGNGFANRFLFAWVERRQCLPDGGQWPEEELAPYVNELQAVIRHAAFSGEFRRDQEARDLWHRVYPTLSAGKPGLLGAVTGRAEPQVMRLAVLYAILDGTSVIRKPHLEAALELWRYCEESAKFVFGDSLGDPRLDNLYRALCAAEPTGLTRTEIMRDLYGGNADKALVAEHLARLIEYRLVWCEKEKGTGTKPRERWHANPLQPHSAPGSDANENNELTQSGVSGNSCNSCNSCHPVLSEEKMGDGPAVNILQANRNTDGERGLGEETDDE